MSRNRILALFFVSIVVGLVVAAYGGTGNGKSILTDPDAIVSPNQQVQLNANRLQAWQAATPVQVGDYVRPTVGPTPHPSLNDTPPVKCGEISFKELTGGSFQNLKLAMGGNRDLPSSCAGKVDHTVAFFPLAGWQCWVFDMRPGEKNSDGSTPRRTILPGGSINSAQGDWVACDPAR